jgi:hypothetical protein
MVLKHIRLNKHIIIISPLISPLLGHKPSSWITHKENWHYPTTRTQCGLVGANDCKCSRNQCLNVSAKARRSSDNNFWSPIQ